jgi:hypothetical protein
LFTDGSANSPMLSHGQIYHGASQITPQIHDANDMYSRGIHRANTGNSSNVSGTMDADNSTDDDARIMGELSMSMDED